MRVSTRSYRTNLTHLSRHYSLHLTHLVVTSALTHHTHVDFPIYNSLPCVLVTSVRISIPYSCPDLQRSHLSIFSRLYLALSPLARATPQDLFGYFYVLQPRRSGHAEHRRAVAGPPSIGVHHPPHGRPSTSLAPAARYYRTHLGRLRPPHIVAFAAPGLLRRRAGTRRLASFIGGGDAR